MLRTFLEETEMPPVTKNYWHINFHSSLLLQMLWQDSTLECVEKMVGE